MNQPDRVRISENPERVSSKRLRIFLAASGGGHLRQLLDLEPLWSPHDYRFLTERSALSESLEKDHPVEFLPHFAFGQLRTGAPLRMAAAAFVNLFKSAWIALRGRPDVVISTGAAAAYFVVLWARLFGAKLVIIESFARFELPSLFGRMTGPFAHRKVVQCRRLLSYWPNAVLFDPLRILNVPRPEKKHLLVVTVGAVLPFDRLVSMVSDIVARGEVSEDILVQTGAGGFKPPGLNSVETLPFDEMQERLRDADIVICHGGTGSIITALRQGCKVIVVPRLFALKEAYDDHQAEITRAFSDRGLIDVAQTTEELSMALKKARLRSPVSATTDQVELISYLTVLLDEWTRNPRHKG